MKEFDYRGYRVRYHCGAEWLAHVFKPGSSHVTPVTLKASLAEGEDALLKRARDRIDAEAPGNDGINTH